MSRTSTTPSPTPSGTPSSEQRAFELSIDIQASPLAVWKALTESRLLSSWFAPEAKVEPGVGGSVTWAWGALEWPQTIEIWEPEAHLRTRYEAAIEDGQVPLYMDFEIEGRGGGTRLRLVHSGFGPEQSFDQEYDGISRGWPVELRSLRLFLEQHAGKTRNVAFVTESVTLALDEAFERLVGPAGFACGSAISELAEGEPFRIQLPKEFGGEVLSGRALRCAPREFSGCVESHGNGFLRLTTENCGGQHMAWLWLALYDDEERAALFQKRFEALANRLYGDVRSPA